MATRAHKIINGKKVFLTSAQEKEISENEGFSEERGFAAQIPSRRQRRNELLSATDWTQLHDNNLPGVARDAWAKYRQELRGLDFTQNPMIWPEVPGMAVKNA